MPRLAKRDASGYDLTGILAGRFSAPETYMVADVPAFCMAAP
jgi:hypothetical protein